VLRFAHRRRGASIPDIDQPSAASRSPPGGGHRPGGREAVAALTGASAHCASATTEPAKPEDP